MIQRYMSKISGPLLDRIDIHIDIPAVKYKELRAGAAPEGSCQIRERVVKAREIQLNRFAAAGERIYCNAQMAPRQIRTYCDLSTDCERLLERAMAQQGLSARAHDRILKFRARSRTWKAPPTSSPSTLRKRFSTGRWTGRIGRSSAGTCAVHQPGRTVVISMESILLRTRRLQLRSATPELAVAGSKQSF